MKVLGMFLAIALVLGGPSGLALAQTATDLNNQAARMNTLAASQGESKVIGKISGDFNSFLGSNSNAVVTGLRNGSPITMTTTTPSSTPGGAPTITTTTINPPTGKMGHGNVFISLALAKQQLGQMGISQPTPEQLQAALTGGTITTGTGTTATTTQLQGILTMRSQHMGWGQIAQKLGTKLGPVISSMKHANQSMTTTSASSTGSQSTSASSGIVSGSGKSHGQAVSGKDSSGEGIVSGSGRSVGNDNAYGKGIVTGSGQAARGNSGITTSGGHGNSGYGKGQGK